MLFYCFSQRSKFVYCPSSPAYGPLPTVPSMSPSYGHNSVTSYPQAPVTSECFFIIFFIMEFSTFLNVAVLSFFFQKKKYSNYWSQSSDH